jgi:hypothetical protein
MITSVFSILLSISIINTGVINTQELSELDVPDTGFTQETTLQTTNSTDNSDFSYFLEVQLPKIKENAAQAQQKQIEIDQAAEKAKQEELARIEQEKSRIAQELERIRIQREQEEAQRQAQEEARRRSVDIANVEF